MQGRCWRLVVVAEAAFQAQLRVFLPCATGRGGEQHGEPPSSELCGSSCPECGRGRGAGLLRSPHGVKASL